MKKKLFPMHARFCLSCSRRWAATWQASKRPCPFCGSRLVTKVKQ